MIYLQGDADWTRFEKEIVLPSWTKWSELKLFAEGNGQAWLDEVSGSDGVIDPGREVTADDEMRNAPPPKDKPWVPGWCIHDWRAAGFGMHDGSQTVRCVRQWVFKTLDRRPGERRALIVSPSPFHTGARRVRSFR